MGTAMSSQRPAVAGVAGRDAPARATSRKKDKPNAVEELNGAITRAPFIAGEPIREAKLIRTNGAAGFMAAILPSGHARRFDRNLARNRRRRLHPAERSRRRHPVAPRPRKRRKGANASPTSETILTNVRVLAIDQTVEEKNGQRVVVGKTATLEIAPRQAETLTQSRQLGTLSLALRSLLDASKTERVEDNDRKTEINTVRFGVSTTNDAIGASP